MTINHESPEQLVAEVPVWLQATTADFESVDFEAPIKDIRTASTESLSALYNRAIEALDQPVGENSQADLKVFSMLQALTNLHMRPENRNAPYGAMLVTHDRRSAVPEDFRGRPVSTLSSAAQSITNPVLRARVTDVCWLLERKRHEIGRVAVASYAEIVTRLASGELDPELERERPLLSLTANYYLRRALSIGRALKDEELLQPTKQLLSDARRTAVEVEDKGAIHRFGDLDLDFAVSDPVEIGRELEHFLTSHGGENDFHWDVELWRLAARAYHLGSDTDGKFRCRSAAAETLVKQAEQNSSAMMVAHWLGSAISEYHGVPDKRERRTQLRHRLIDAQAGIPDEMSSFSHSMNIKEIFEATEKAMDRELSLVELLMVFADFERSPDPDKLREEAISAINKHPLSSLFGTSFHDDEGKVIHKTDGGLTSDIEKESSIRVNISQHEGIRRNLNVVGVIEPARVNLQSKFYLGEDVFTSLMSHSPFVPHDLQRTFGIGFTRFFSGDYTSALYILTPLLENSIRHILKLHGRDVTILDDATGIQQDRTISSMFEQMRTDLEEIFGRNITSEIERLFLSKPGPSLRHNVAHGLLNDGSPLGADAIYACWFIFRLCCMPMFKGVARPDLPA